MKPSLKKKIALGFSVGVILLLTIGILSYQSIIRYEEDNTQVKHTQSVVDKIENLNTAVFRVVAIQRGFVITGDKVFSDAYVTRKAEIPVKIKELEAGVLDNPVQAGNLKKLESILNFNLLRTDSILRLREQVGFDAAKELQQKTADQRILAEVTALTEEMKQEELRYLNARLMAAEKSASNTKTAIIAGSIFAVIFTVIAFLIILKDINEKKRIEAKLGESEALYKTLIKNLPDETITIYNSEMRYLLVEGGGFSKMGYDPKTIEGKLIKEAIPAENYRLFEPHYRGVFEGKSSTFEYNFKDRIIEITFLPLPEKQGKIRNGMVITHDITERKKAEEEVRKSEALYKTIMSSYPRGSITLYDKELKILLADGSEIAAHGFTKEHILNKKLDEILPPEILEPQREKLLSVFEGQSISYESSLNGEDYIVTNIPIKNGNGKVTSGLSISNNVTLLKETEKALRKSEALYKSIMSSFPQGTLSLYDRDTTIIMLDGEDVKTLGFNKEELVGKKIKDLIPSLAPDAPPGTLERYTCVFEGKTSTYESGFKGNYYLVTNTPIRDENGEILYGMSISRNITPIKSAEEDAKRSQLLYKTMMDNFPNGTISLFNKNLVRTLIGGQELMRQNISHEDVINKPVEMLLPETGYEQYLDYYRKVFEGESTTFELPNEERTYLVSVLPIKNENGEIISGLSLSQNITHLKNYEKKLKRSETLLAQAQQIAHTGSWEWDVENNTLTWSDEMYRIFGLDPQAENITYEKYVSLLHPDTKEMVLQTIEDAYKQGSSYDFEHKITRPSGEIRILHGQGRVVTNESGIVTRLFGVAHDITERKVTEEQLKEANKKLLHSEKLAALGRFSSNISHEIRNPLANINASAQLITSKFKPEPPLSTYLDIIMRNSTTASRIIKELLDFASPRELLLEKNDVLEVINEACELVSARCQQNNVSMSFVNRAGNVPHILMNQEKLQEALLNFLSNAIDAMPEGGKLDVILDREKDSLNLDIRDSGYGIPPENLEKIFEPFFTTKENGTGLGISLAHQIIQNHNGRLDIESGVGEGTTIKIKLPLQEQ